MHSDRPRGVGETKEARKMGRRKKDSRWRTYSEQQQCSKRSSAVSSTLVMPTPMTSPRPRRSRLDPIPPNEPLDHETRHTWNPRSARDTCVPHEDSPFWTPRPKNVPKDDAHRHTPRTCIEARNVYLNSLYFLSLISPIFHVQHSFPCI